MKKVLLLSLFFVIIPLVNVSAQDKFRIDKVLREISPKEAEQYNPLFVSTYTLSIDGYVVSKRYFVATSSPQHNSSVKVMETESSTQPWLLEINGRRVYVQFDNSSGLRSGDEGVLQYYNDELYLIVD